MKNQPLAIQHFAGQLAELHGIDLSETPSCLHLKQEEMMLLVVSSCEEDELHVAFHNEPVEEDELYVSFFSLRGC